MVGSIVGLQSEEISQMASEYAEKVCVVEYCKFRCSCMTGLQHLSKVFVQERSVLFNCVASGAPRRQWKNWKDEWCAGAQKNVSFFRKTDRQPRKKTHSGKKRAYLFPVWFMLSVCRQNNTELCIMCTFNFGEVVSLGMAELLYLTIRLRAWDFYEVIVDEGEARINYHLIEIESE